MTPLLLLSYLFGCLGVIVIIVTGIGTYRLGKRVGGRCLYVVEEKRLKYFKMKCILKGCDRHFYVLRKNVRDELDEELS